MTEEGRFWFVFVPILLVMTGILLGVAFGVSHHIERQSLFSEKCVVAGGVPKHFSRTNSICFSANAIIKIEP